MAKWNQLKKNPRVKPRFAPNGEIKLPVITKDKFKFYNDQRDEHRITQRRNLQKNLGEADMQALEKELTTGHTRFQDMGPLAENVSGSLEESSSAFFAPSGKGQFVDAKEGDINN
eukprot:475545-Pyramimonas_sp.AAC.1